MCYHVDPGQDTGQVVGLVESLKWFDLSWPFDNMSNIFKTKAPAEWINQVYTGDQGPQSVNYQSSFFWGVQGREIVQCFGLKI